jgi:lauroyl/myristoyl acyltransferase
MSAVPDALAELDDIAAHGVELLSQPVEQSRMYWRVRQDPYIALSLLSLAPVAMCVGDCYWPSICRAIVRVTPLGRSGLRRRSETSAGLRLAFAGTVDDSAITAELDSHRLELRLQILRDLLLWNWRPDIRVEGIAHLEAALAAGRGAILWIGRFAFADTVAKIGLHRAGHPPAHLSRTIHGFSHSLIGRRWLNPIKQRMENRYLAERVVLNDTAPGTAMRRLHKVLLGNGVVSITVDSWGAHVAEAPFLGGRLRVATGAPSLAWKTGARLLPVFVRRDPASGAFRVLIDDPLPTEPTRSKGEAQQAAAAQYLRRLEAHAVAAPGQWRDWAKLRPAAASPP